MLDVEAWLVDYLNGRMLAPAYTDVPTGATPPPSFVVIRRTGGGTRTRVSDEPLIVVEAYARARADAWALMDEARDLILALATRHGNVIVYRSTEIGGPALLPNPKAPLHTRYTAMYQLHVRN